jgi:hypothetical protein
MAIPRAVAQTALSAVSPRLARLSRPSSLPRASSIPGWRTHGGSMEQAWSSRQCKLRASRQDSPASDRINECGDGNEILANATSPLLSPLRETLSKIGNFRFCHNAMIASSLAKMPPSQLALLTSFQASDCSLSRQEPGLLSYRRSGIARWIWLGSSRA